MAAAGIALVVVYCMETEPHKFPQDKCPTCHVTDRAGNVMGKQLTASVTSLCEKCHAKILKDGYMHPLNVRPQKVKIPADFPLSRSGEFVCTTCHDIHSPYFTPYGAPSRYLRRLEAGKKFCEICHAGVSAKAGHAGAVGEAHFQSKYIQTTSSQTIDPMSKNCISCHDGSFASSVSISAGAWTHRKELMSHDAGSHPIGVDYEGARAKKGRWTPLRPIVMVDKRIRFFDGKVGCGSCHDPYSTIEKRLVMSDERSRLCFACHLIGGG
jgi:predicted CXXCH cytochrome family protein